MSEGASSPAPAGDERVAMVRETLRLSAFLLLPICVAAALIADPALAISIAAGGLIAGLNFLLLARKLAGAIDQTLAGVAEARVARGESDGELGVDPADVPRAPGVGSFLRLLILLGVIAGVLMWPEARPIGLAVGVLVVLIAASVAAVRRRTA